MQQGVQQKDFKFTEIKDKISNPTNKFYSHLYNILQTLEKPQEKQI